MAQSTKHLLAQSLKELMAEKPLDKITVKEIVNRCGVNRQTFYYHFRDIYDLLDWLFIEEGKEFSRRHPNYYTSGDGESAIRKMCNYLIENRQMAINIYNSLGRDIFGVYLAREMAKMLRTALMQRALSSGISEETIAAVVNFYKHAVVGSLLDWVDAGLRGNVETIVELYLPLLEGSVDAALNRLTAN